MRLGVKIGREIIEFRHYISKDFLLLFVSSDESKVFGFYGHEELAA